ncbi:hypothetical protein QBC36DRAFT_334171 [Triangularia setosa]|uniref:Uncharacterized protein n=1 Tax=Triangularia setosa TaxID=2587417 RepID=A0AAN6W2H0_9PEZI|nr:hypothetical protein QBC36DRAFT_334171 [Podospora setosa]
MAATQTQTEQRPKTVRASKSVSFWSSTSPSKTATGTATPPESLHDEILPHKHGGARTNAGFTGLALEFNKQLAYAKPTDEKGIEIPSAQRVFRARDPNKQYLPGQPRIRFGEFKYNVDGEEGTLTGYLKRWHLTPDLDDLLPFMRYVFVQTPAYEHINTLHHHAAHGRKIIVDEEPGLHLVWYYEQIFMKPIPKYFYSKAFWDWVKEYDKKLEKACVGFMRTYYYIIGFEIDFHEACEKRLIPKKDDGEFPTYEEWCLFMVPFSVVGDDFVNRRYHYGELRLTRINRTAMFFRFKLAYFHLLPQWGAYLSHILAPLITAFAVCSVILNSMQVTLAAIEVANETDHVIPDPVGWRRFMNVSLYFPVIVILSIALVIGAALMGMFAMGLKDLFKGNSVREKKKAGYANVGRKSHGIIW